MSEPEKFLTRWSRRKLVAEEPAPPPAAEAAPQKPVEDNATSGGTAGKTAVPPEPVFDPASLPSLDSISMETDITAFLKPGVPGELRLAALRRAWVTDPAIRDFKGLAENDWDFTVPNATMGFGEIDPGLDVKKMLADVFGDAPRDEPPAPELPAAPEQLVTKPLELSSPPADRLALNSPDEPSREAEITSGDELMQRNKNIASQTKDDEADIPLNKRRRPQGGALPQ